MTNTRIAVALTLLITLWVFVLSEVQADSPNDQPTAAARSVAEVVRREATLPPNGPQGRPLPLASHWNVGTVRGTFEPDHQIELIQSGHFVLPWMSWPSGDPESNRFRDYYERLLACITQMTL